jgi:gliding motility-associated-like protein
MKSATIKISLLSRVIGLLVLFMMAGFLSNAQILDTLCAGAQQQVYHVLPTPGSKYSWFIDCGVMDSPNGADSVAVTWCATPGLHTVKVVETNLKGCVGDTMMAFILIRGTAAIDGPVDICLGEMVKLKASGTQNFIWSTGEKKSEIIVSPQKDTTYFLITQDNCTGQDSIAWKINVHEKPTASFTYSPKNPHVDETINFQFTGKNADNISWTFNDSIQQIMDEKNPEYTFRTPGTRKVTLVVRNASGCMDTVSYTFYLKREAYIFVPNAFTPNDDKKNEIFKPAGYGIRTYNIQIYNRWGEKLFESDQFDRGWDGTYKGEIVPEGVYIYKIAAQGVDGYWHFLKGNITVIR